MRWIWLPLILLTAVHAQLPPSPPGAILIPPKPVSPKFAEQIQSWGAPMRSTPSFAPKVVTLPGFTITNLAVTGGQVTLQWKEGVPPFQVIGEPTLYGPWNDVGIPTTARTKTFPEDINHFFTVQGNIVMPLEATRTNNLTRLTWEAPDTAMSDSLQAFTLKRSTDGGATFPNTVAVVQPGETYSVDDTTAIPAGGSLTWELLEQTLNGVVVPYSKPSATNMAPGTALWAHGYGGTDDDFGMSVAVDIAGNICIGGIYNGFGTGFGAAFGTGSFFLSKLGPTGNTLWTKGFGVGAGASVACSADGVKVATRFGKIVVVGIVSGTMDFSGVEQLAGGVPPTLGTDMFIAQYNSSDGHFLWARRIGVAGSSQLVKSVAIDSSGNILLTGNFAGHVNFGDVTTTKDSGIFIIKLSGSDGTTSWSKQLGSNTTAVAEVGYSIAIGSDDASVITGLFVGAASDFGDGHTLASLSTAGNIFVAKYRGSDGVCQWANGYGNVDGNVNWGISLALDTTIAGANAVLVSGILHSSSVDFGKGPVSNSAFVVRLSNTGVAQWSEGFSIGSTADPDGANGLTTDSAGSAILSGAFTGTMTIGSKTINAIGSPGIFAAKLDSSGSIVWLRAFGTTGGQFGGLGSFTRSCSVGPDNAPILIGTFQATAGTTTFSLSFDGHSVPSVGKNDVFVVKLSP